MKKYLPLILGLLIIIASPKSVLAGKRPLPTATKSNGTVSTKPSSGKVNISVKFRGDRRAIVLNFSNVNSATKISYTLSYTANTGMQGVNGSITPSGVDTAQRELIFGTCSSSVCRYDTGIKDARLTVRTTLRSGKVIVNTYKLKV